MLGALALPAPAWAELQILPPKAPGGAEMLAYAGTPAYAKLMAQAMARIPASLVPRCAKLVVEDGAIILQQPVQFGPDKAPVGGAWRHSRPAHGCGPETLLNFFFYATADHRVLTVLGVPGDSHGDLDQQRTARTYVLMALDAAASTCHSFETANTRFEGYGTKRPDVADGGPAAPFRAWWETWTMLGCGKHYIVPLNFMPNRLGLQIVQPGGIETR